MSSISPQQSQYYKEYITPFQPHGRMFFGYDLRGTQTDRFGNGNLRLVGYGDSSGGYAFTVDNQDSAYAPSLNSSNLSNISNAPPRLTELQDYSGKWIDTITLHALDEFIEQVEAQSFIANTLRIFTGGQKGYRGDGTGNRNTRNSYTLVTEIYIPALTRADIPRSFTVKCGVYIPPAQNIYLGLAIPQPYTCSFEMWDLQANTQIGSGLSGGGGSDTVASGNELSEDLSQTPTDTNFVLPLTFASATWVRGNGSSGGGGVNPPPPSTVPPIISGSSRPSEDEDEDQPEASSPSSPSSPTAAKKEGDSVPPPSEGGCTPIQDCSWFEVSIPKTQAQQQINLGDYTGLCPEGKICRGLVEFETSGTFVICCGPATFPPGNLGCSSLVKWSCVSGGVCVEDVLGTYNSQAECQAALVPALFSGGQCLVAYNTSWRVTYSRFVGAPTVILVTINGFSGAGVRGPLTGVRIVSNPLPSDPNYGLFEAYLLCSDFGGTPYERLIDGRLEVGVSSILVENLSVARADGNPDNCGNPPPTCP